MRAPAEKEMRLGCSAAGTSVAAAPLVDAAVEAAAEVAVAVFDAGGGGGASFFAHATATRAPRQRAAISLRMW